MDTGKLAGVKLLSKKEQKKFDWKELNKVSMFKFKQVKYLLLALTTLYTPVTRNAIQMVLCAPKYAYGKYACYLNNTDQLVRTFYASPQEPDDQNTCVEGYMFVANASDFQDTSEEYMVITEKTCGTFIDDKIKNSTICVQDDFPYVNTESQKV